MKEKIIVYRSAISCAFNELKTKAIFKNEELPSGCYWTKAEAWAAYEILQKIKLEEYDKYKPLAMKRLSVLESEIKSLLKESDCELDFTYKGDTYGIYDESLVISTTINNRNYEKEVSF